MLMLTVQVVASRCVRGRPLMISVLSPIVPEWSCRKAAVGKTGHSSTSKSANQSAHFARMAFRAWWRSSQSLWLSACMSAMYRVRASARSMAGCAVLNRTPARASAPAAADRTSPTSVATSAAGSSSHSPTR